ncbi:MAG: aldehyde dehydrogenase family protein [Phycisphaerales bacterium]|nr:aldehyde dehydrogenase family protein [Phycisphaerales bacterium]
MTHPALNHPPSNLFAGTWHPIPGQTLTSRNPAKPASINWQGAPTPSAIDPAIQSARQALPAWSNTPLEQRFAILRHFQKLCAANQQKLADLITDETGKILWDAKSEAALLPAKVDITLDPAGALARVTPFEIPVSSTRTGRALFRPHGVMAVIGPYNFPLHLPNGHIIPALAMGNTIVFKPSDKAPACGQLLAELLQESLDAHNAPTGVMNLIQGGAEIASALTKHNDIDGILFTGSWPVGRRIMEANLDRPTRMLALEMGGNNAALIMDDADLRQALIECLRCAFISTGQRCTCTRRIIIHEKIAHKFIPAFCKAASSLIVGDPRDTIPVFMGPIISEPARRAVIEFQTALQRAGAEILVPATEIETPDQGWYLTPGVALVDRFHANIRRDGHCCDQFDAGCDIEVFGPLVRICTAKSLDEGLTQLNATNYGLAASIFTHSQPAIDRFLTECRSGCLNINCGTAGASSKLPFGGLGLSGNHRPAGAFSLDYCAYPLANMTESGPDAQLVAGMRMDNAWLS